MPRSYIIIYIHIYIYVLHPVKFLLTFSPEKANVKLFFTAGWTNAHDYILTFHVSQKETVCMCVCVCVHVLYACMCVCVCVHVLYACMYATLRVPPLEFDKMIQELYI